MIKLKLGDTYMVYENKNLFIQDVEKLLKKANIWEKDEIMKILRKNKFKRDKIVLRGRHV